MTENSWICVTYSDWAQNKKLNATRSIEKKFNKTDSFFSRMREFFTEIYLLNKKYVHCELALPNIEDSTSCIAYGVFSDQGVFKKTRTFSNPSYGCLILSVSQSELATISDFCTSHLNEPFDEKGYIWSPFWQLKSKKKTWYCTSFVIAALQSIGILKGYPITSLDTDDIVKILSNHKKFINGTLTSMVISRPDSSHSLFL